MLEITKEEKKLSKFFSTHTLVFRKEKKGREFCRLYTYTNIRFISSFVFRRWKLLLPLMASNVEWKAFLSSVPKSVCLIIITQSDLICFVADTHDYTQNFTDIVINLHHHNTIDTTTTTKNPKTHEKFFSLFLCCWFSSYLFSFIFIFNFDLTTTKISVNQRKSFPFKFFSNKKNKLLQKWKFFFHECFSWKI